MSDIRYQRNAEVLQTVVEDELVLLSPELRFVSLNETAARIWELLAEPTTLAQIASVLVDEFDVDEDVATRAAEQTVATLTTSDSVRIVD